jgi:hypothetical protein
VYPIVHIDALVLKVRTDGTVVNRPAYLAIGVDVEGRKHILGVWLGDGGEGAKFWTTALADIKTKLSKAWSSCAATALGAYPTLSKPSGRQRSCKPASFISCAPACVSAAGRAARPSQPRYGQPTPLPASKPQPTR